MCGISGIVRKGAGEDLSATIKTVTGAMAHRGPDADGFFVTEEIALGHRRLSILDLSSASNQPFTDCSGRYVMVFNGEIYNFKDIRAEIRDYPFITTGDTEVVIAAFAKWGPACLEKFRGMFAIAIWDKMEHSLFLARDRFGVKPLYYVKDDNTLVFASEIRALLASGMVARKLDRGALLDYLKYQSFVTPHTVVEGITELKAGTWLLLREGQIKQTVYWDIAAKCHPLQEADESSVHKEIERLFYQAVERRLVSDVPLGAFLSGGIDSSLVVAVMSRVNKDATNAFTIAFDEKEYDESPYAEMIARKFKVNHTKVLLKPEDFLEKLPEALCAMDSPSGDGLNTYVVSQAIRRSGIVVALSGIGGDELFAGYPIFRQYHGLRKWTWPFDHSRRLRRAASAMLPSGDQKYQRVGRLLNSPTSSIADVYPAFRQIQNDRYLQTLLPKTRPGVGLTLESNLRESQRAISHFPVLSQVSIADYLGYTQSVLLKDADQMSMAASLELREPFFDQDMVEYVLNVPDKFKYPDYPKSLLIRSMSNLLPDEIVHRKKQGFVLPYALWIKNELRDFCEQKIGSLAARGYFSEEALIGFWQSYLQGKPGIRWADIWIFVVLEHWLEKNEVS
jgi:asparagine synthase (glutamine-hydrolysing)